MITLCNLRKEKPKHPWDVRVDRSSILGNPFKGDRNTVCDQYQVYFDEQVEANTKVFMDELRRLWQLHQQYKQLRLFCWCVPLRCHIMIIKAFLSQYLV